MSNRTILTNEISKYLKNVYKLDSSNIARVLKISEKIIDKWSKLERSHLSPNLMADEIMEVVYAQELI
ncbi:hypothetical protein ACFJZD_00530 [Enterococcus faecalis]|uniref:hypothetical protein n=1 Tax=Enterococcus faecalis TaxID=1351 RepID=UPI0018848DB8|nr:hypothetical protein [Enterococcus faecalis]EGO8565379.1 hypothetical protein [Enterococcus faecalis]EGO8899525.1 hypothetical protein [Enterococcus faecalis]EGO9037749.1 hypothetical protein [Enterococcus faecalis]EGO9402907.1 hypothetical protein [Enterococcus faecalis]EIM5504932.1 hypothetical protein [Enterococcus faecalis]